MTAPKEIGDWVRTRYQGKLAYRYKPERGHRAYITTGEGEAEAELFVDAATGIVPFVPVKVVRALLEDHDRKQGQTP